MCFLKRSISKAVPSEISFAICVLLELFQYALLFHRLNNRI
jgi:hypothetical protein